MKRLAVVLTQRASREQARLRPKVPGWTDRGCAGRGDQRFYRPVEVEHTLKRSWARRSIVTAELPGQQPEMPLRSWLVELVLRTLPLDEQRRRVVLVGMAFADRAPYDAAIAQSLADGDAEIRGNLQLLFLRAVHEGELDPSIDHKRLARLILSLAAGLAGQLLYDDVPENQVRALVDMAIRALLTPAPPSGGAPR
jgi:hypothetical protein